MEENKIIWNQCSKPPKTALKQINSGSLKGMTDINPQWRYEIMTEMFGPCGNRWGYTVDKLWTEQVENEVLCFALVTVWHGNRENTIPGCGGSKIVEWFNQKKYARNNDEGFKMAITDALSTALKMLGVGADIYAGKWDGTKYKDDPPEPPKEMPAGKVEDVRKLLLNADTGVKIDNISNMTLQYVWTEDQTAELKTMFKDKRDEVKNGTAN